MLIHPLDFRKIGEPFDSVIPQFLDLLVYFRPLALSVAIKAQEFKVGRQQVNELVGCTSLVSSERDARVVIT